MQYRQAMRGERIERRRLDFLCVAQQLGGAEHRSRDLRMRVALDPRARERDLERTLEIEIERRARRERIARVVARDCLEHERAIFGAARERADAVERMGERHRAMAGDASPRRL